MKILRKILRFFRKSLMYVIYWPHYIAFQHSPNHEAIAEDIRVNAHYNRISASPRESFFRLMRNNRYFRTLFFYRVGRLSHFLWGGAEKTFIISAELGPGCYVAHPYATTIFAKRIGRNFTCHQCTTVGVKGDMNNNQKPIIGDNVVLGTNVCVIGGITIGNNVIIGAGAVVVKDVPDNCIVVGNPGKIIGKVKKDENTDSQLGI